MLKRLGLILSTVLLIVSSFVLAEPPALATTYQVKMGTDNGLLRFDPDNLTINIDDTVQWVNNKLAPHNVVFDSSKIDPELAKQLSHKNLLFAPGESYQSTFTQSGEYPYYCQPHRGAGMIGKIIVQSAEESVSSSLIADRKK